jgi:hypothetical protein
MSPKDCAGEGKVPQNDRAAAPEGLICCGCVFRVNQSPVGSVQYLKNGGVPAICLKVISAREKENSCSRQRVVAFYCANAVKKCHCESWLRQSVALELLVQLVPFDFCSRSYLHVRSTSLFR